MATNCRHSALLQLSARLRLFSTARLQPKNKGLRNILYRTSRIMAGVGGSVGLVCGWQYYKLRTSYVPLTPPKGALSGVESPSSCRTNEKISEEVEIVFLGDSLVIGIGCPDRREGPVFARRFSRLVAERMGKRVRWRVFGIDGGDVESIRDMLLNEISNQTHKNSANVAAVVIMCGLNDYKRLLQEGRSPSTFKKDLRQLIHSVRNLFGEQARIVLPALPVERAPLFRSLFPMNQILYKVAEVWDHQKDLLSKEEKNVNFVTGPEHYATDDWAVDGIHPSEKGYKKWGEHLVLRVFRHQQ